MDRTGTQTAGGALMGSAAMMVLAMSHHPSSAHAGALNMGVHGLLIALAGVSAYGFFHWARLRGLDRPAVAAGLVAYMIALFGHLGAATINGFLVTALVHHGDADAGVHQLAWNANQALAGIGVFAASAAYLLWSVDLLRRGGTLHERGLGIAGLIAGAVPVLLLGTGLLRMNLGGALIVYGIHWVWMALVGLLMIRSGSRVSG
jgi:hypothetical protein